MISKNDERFQQGWVLCVPLLMDRQVPARFQYLEVLLRQGIAIERIRRTILRPRSIFRGRLVAHEGAQYASTIVLIHVREVGVLRGVHLWFGAFRRITSFFASTLFVFVHHPSSGEEGG